MVRTFFFCLSALFLVFYSSLPLNFGLAGTKHDEHTLLPRPFTSAYGVRSWVSALWEEKDTRIGDAVIDVRYTLYGSNKV